MTKSKLLIHLTGITSVFFVFVFVNTFYASIRVQDESHEFWGEHYQPEKYKLHAKEIPNGIQQYFHPLGGPTISKRLFKLCNKGGIEYIPMRPVETHRIGIEVLCGLPGKTHIGFISYKDLSKSESKMKKIFEYISIQQ